MCASRADHTTDPLWLTIKPAWKQEVQAFSQATGVDVLRALTTHGLRHCVNELDLQDGLMRTSHETFLEDEPENEEGWATENQVRLCDKELLKEMHSICYHLFVLLI